MRAITLGVILIFTIQMIVACKQGINLSAEKTAPVNYDQLPVMVQSEFFRIKKVKGFSSQGLPRSEFIKSLDSSKVSILPSNTLGWGPTRGSEKNEIQIDEIRFVYYEGRQAPPFIYFNERIYFYVTRNDHDLSKLKFGYWDLSKFLSK